MLIAMFDVIVWWLLFAAAIFAALHLIAWYRGPQWLVYVAKPATMVLIIFATLMIDTSDPAYRTAIVVGLVLSLAGDVFLMLPGDRFVAGLVSFLAAHVAYFVALSLGTGFGRRPFLLLPYVALAGAILAFLWPRLGRLRLPVMIYVAVLVVMAWQAASRASILGSWPAVFAAAGAALFVVSDATLAINRFRVPFRAAQAVVMPTYVLAQMLIALSAAR